MSEIEAPAAPESAAPAELHAELHVRQEIVDQESIVSAGIRAYTGADDGSKAALHELAAELVTLRTLYANPSSQANRDRVRKLWDGVEMTAEDRKRRMSAVNYVVRTIEATRDGRPTPSQVVAAASKSARQAAKTTTATVTEKVAQPAGMSDAVGQARIDPVAAARQVTQLLNGISAVLTGKADIDRETLTEIAKAVKAADAGLATVKANLAARAKATTKAPAA